MQTLLDDQTSALSALPHSWHALSSTLYVVPTPIGNLEDISFRALKVLGGVSAIAAEDSRRTQHLLAALNLPSKSIYPLHRHNEKAATKKILAKLREGNSIALVSDAGTPALQDPGLLLIQGALALEISVIVLPGPCALMTALVGSGLETSRFAFKGFFPTKYRQAEALLSQLETDEAVQVYYEAPHRIMQTLQCIRNICGPNLKIALARELTKVWEQRFTGTIDSLIAAIEAKQLPLKGEFVLMLEGAKPDALLTPVPALSSVLESKMAQLIERLTPILSKKDLVQLLADGLKIKKQVIYRYLAEQKRV